MRRDFYISKIFGKIRYLTPILHVLFISILWQIIGWYAFTIISNEYIC